MAEHGEGEWKVVGKKKEGSKDGKDKDTDGKDRKSVKGYFIRQCRL